MTGRLKAYGRSLFTPLILFLTCHECLCDSADDLADLLEDACDYHKITKIESLVSLLPLFKTQKDEGRPRVVIMPNLANKFEERLELIQLISQHDFPVHYVGILALTESIETLKTLSPGKHKCEPVREDELAWFLPEFTCVIDSLAGIDIMRRFIAMALPEFI